MEIKCVVTVNGQYLRQSVYYVQRQADSKGTRSLLKKRFREGMFKLSKRWDKCQNGNSDYEH
jgi:hypothetical protein